MLRLIGYSSLGSTLWQQKGSTMPRGDAIASGRHSALILQYFMSSAGKNQTAVAAILGTHNSLISRIFHGKRNLTLDEIELLAKSLNVPMPVLVAKAFIAAERASGRRRRKLDELDALIQEMFPEHFKEP